MNFFDILWFVALLFIFCLISTGFYYMLKSSKYAKFSNWGSGLLAVALMYAFSYISDNTSAEKNHRERVQLFEDNSDKLKDIINLWNDDKKEAIKYLDEISGKTTFPEELQGSDVPDNT